MTIETYTGELVESKPTLQQWALDMQAAMQIAEVFCQTPFVPDSYRKTRAVKRTNNGREYTVQEAIPGPEGVNVATAAAAILYGFGIGFDPPQALAKVVVVKGKASLYAEAMQALLLQHGHRIEIDKQSERECTVIAQRKGSNQEHTFSWTIDRARKAGYLSNTKYETDPIAMLTARALSEACRRTAPDLLMGLSSADELEDYDDAPVTVERIDANSDEAQATKPKRAPRKSTAALPAPEVEAPPLPAAEPELLDEEASEPFDEDVPDVTVEPAPTEPVGGNAEDVPLPLPDEAQQAVLDAPPAKPTSKQLAEMVGLMRDPRAGFQSSEERAAYIEDVIGRPAPKPTDLTHDEAQKVIDGLHTFMGDA